MPDLPPVTREWAYATQLEIDTQLESRMRSIIGSPTFDTQSAAVHAYAVGQYQQLVQVILHRGIEG